MVHDVLMLYMLAFYELRQQAYEFEYAHPFNVANVKHAVERIRHGHGAHAAADVLPVANAHYY